jgi:hypothetical protein
VEEALDVLHVLVWIMGVHHIIPRIMASASINVPCRKVLYIPSLGTRNTLGLRHRSKYARPPWNAGKNASWDQ